MQHTWQLVEDTYDDSGKFRITKRWCKTCHATMTTKIRRRNQRITSRKYRTKDGISWNKMGICQGASSDETAQVAGSS